MRRPADLLRVRRYGGALNTSRTFLVEALTAAVVGAICGGVSYLVFAWWHRSLDVSGSVVVSLIAVVVTVAGWTVSQRAQRQLFVQQVKNTARTELVSAIRQRQDHVSGLASLFLNLSVGHEHGDVPRWTEEDWQKWIDEYRRRWRAMDVEWIYLLEQYEVLFPGTASCRRDVVALSRSVQDDVAVFFGDVIFASRRAIGISKCDGMHSRLTDETAVLEDLLVYLQNVTLGSIVRRAVPFREPLDATVPRLVLKGDQLVLMDGTGKRIDAARQLEERVLADYRKAQPAPAEGEKGV